MGAATKKKAKKVKKRWSSGAFRSCGNCESTEHNIRTCAKAGGGAYKKLKGKKK